MGFRRAKEQDINGLLNLLVQVLEIHHELRPDVFNKGVTKYTEDQLQEMINNDDNPIYVLLDGNKVIGHAFCKTRYPSLTHLMKPTKTLYIDDFVIDKDYRKKDFGKALFEYIVLEAKRLNYNNITLNVWSDNKSAIRFYEKMGLKPRSIVMEYELEYGI